MDWDRIAGNWKQLKGKVREQWGKITDDELDSIAGKRDQLVGKIQAKYGMAHEEAERQVEQWYDNMSIEKLLLGPLAPKEKKEKK